MYDNPAQFEPLMPAENGDLEDLAYRLTKLSASLSNELPWATLEGVRELLRIINSYYSNLIEGNNTHPIEVERAMRQDYSNDPARRDRQIESIIHIDVQKKIDTRLEAEPTTRVTDGDFMRWIHLEFYEQMPEDLRWVEGENGIREWVEAGEFRRRSVAVGRHVPPTGDSIDGFMKRFDEFYDPDKIHGMKKFVAIAAAHHRLMWVHPFLDGNGRLLVFSLMPFFTESNYRDTDYGT